MIRLIANGNSVFIYGDPIRVKKVRSSVEPIMKFRPKGFEYSEKYKSGEWDGTISLYKKFTNSFPRGFLNEVFTILELSEIEYEFIDGTQLGKFLPVEVGPLPMTLRPYQSYAVEQAINMKRGVICLPTGTGKTLCAAEIIRRLGLTTVVYVHKLELLHQWTDTLAGLFNMPKTEIGMVGNGVVILKPITIAMVQTVGRLPSALFTDFGVTIFDETHHVAADSVYEISSESKSPYLFGLSATPYRADGKDKMIAGGVGDFIVNYGLTEMIDKGYLAKPSVTIYKTVPQSYPRWMKFADVYRDYIVDNAHRNNLVSGIVKYYADRGMTVYVHVKQVRHGEVLHRLIPDAMWIHGKHNTITRQTAIHKFSKEGGVLISTLLGEGVDVPGMDVLVLACGGLSEVFVRQLIGRVLRITVDKKKVVIVDFDDMARHLADHAQERERIYRSEKAFEVRII
ncbi:MAG: hypothetical protein A2W25_04245 [candidate division Zixibacteria bacterium RBG_16_53_22]|nr:MAG: hypothetical protein A2W25_04245 [candidate division Zixibacteria bacterium RBG_16_53_22]